MTGLISGGILKVLVKHLEVVLIHPAFLPKRLLIFLM